MNSKTTFGPAPNFGFWPFNRGINWFHPNGGWYKHFIQILEFVKLFQMQIYHNFFNEEIDADQCNHTQITLPRSPQLTIIPECVWHLYHLLLVLRVFYLCSCQVDECTFNWVLLFAKNEHVGSSNRLVQNKKHLKEFNGFKCTLGK